MNIYWQVVEQEIKEIYSYDDESYNDDGSYNIYYPIVEYRILGEFKKLDNAAIFLSRLISLGKYNTATLEIKKIVKDY